MQKNQRSGILSWYVQYMGLEEREPTVVHLKSPSAGKTTQLQMGMTLGFIFDICFPKPKQCFPSAEFYHWTDPLSQKQVEVLNVICKNVRNLSKSL